MTMSENVPIKSEGLVYNDDDVTPTVLEPTSGRIFVMNKTGQRIMELCDGKKSVNDIVSVLSARYETEGTDKDAIVTDVNDFLVQAVKGGIVRWQQQPQS
jgi:hypothetical protein